MDKGSKWMKPMNEEYEMAWTKGTFKTRRQTKQIYIYTKLTLIH